jgi:ADP-dependent NAD(P)H-hydrate dehydratase / NAD(P)H-hydrate epimerase
LPVRIAHSVAQVRAAEDVAFAAMAAQGLPPESLMLRAAQGVASAVIDFLGSAYGRRVRLLVGAGNNGGDALYAGALLARRGAKVEAVLISPDAVHRGGLAALLAAGGRIWEPRSRHRAALAMRPNPDLDVVIDGIVGIGATGGLRPEAERALMECRDVPIVAVDVPSGVDVDSGEVHGTYVSATVTVSLGGLKVAHLVDPAAQACGAVELVDLDLALPTPVAGALQARDVAQMMPRAEPAGHKYTRGVVGLRTGSATYPGAAVLSVAGANCGLAGMVRYVGSAADAVQAAHPEVVVGPGKVQAWVVGSGGSGEATSALKASLADGCPVVVDADALLPYMRTNLRLRSTAPVVLTPHAGELARMMSVERSEVEARQLYFAKAAAEKYGAVVLLKGRRSIVAEPGTDRVVVNTTGVPWLATAGSGDVLAGLVGTLLAGGLSIFDAAAVGAWLHGAAGTWASQGRPINAGQIAAAIPGVVGEILA